MGIIETLDAKEWLGLNARLQAKKNALRKALKEKGVLKKGGVNDYDKYSYFSEAQYKELFTELFIPVNEGIAWEIIEIYERGKA